MGRSHPLDDIQEKHLLEETASKGLLQQAEGNTADAGERSRGDKVREAGLSQNPQKGTWILFPPREAKGDDKQRSYKGDLRSLLKGG